MLNQQRPPSGSGFSARRWVAGVLVLAGAAMLAWSAALAIDARVSQAAARQSLEQATRAHASTSPHDAIGALRIAAPTHHVAGGSPIAELTIPRVHLSSVVLHGSDDRTLRRGPGHLEHTPLPGQPGNVAIAGHRDTFFRQLRDVKAGDDVFLNTPQGRFHYQITWARVVNAHDLSVLEPTDDDVLTLVTCFPFWVLGPAPDRFVVRATRVDARTIVAPEPVSFSSITPEVVAIERHVNEQRPVPTAAVDDEVLIRRAIERFRVVYNTWLVNHNEHGAGLLHLSACHVSINGDRADAACDASLGNATAGARHVRTLTLERQGDDWAIRSTTD